MINSKGTAMIAALLFVLISAIATSSYLVLVTNEGRMTEGLNNATRAFYLAEAGIEQAIYQLSQNPYNINTTDISQTPIAVGQEGTYQVSMVLNVIIGSPNTVNITSTGTFRGQTRRILTVVSLESILGRYLVVADRSTWASGTGAQYGTPDWQYPQGVPFTHRDRMAMYLFGNYDAQSNVNIYGDILVEGNFYTRSNTYLHGDAYLGGNFDNDGTINDGYTIADGDRPSDLQVLSEDQKITYPDLDMTYYSTNSDLSLAGTKYLKFEESGDHTRVKEYTNSSYTSLVATYELPAEAILYVNGDVHVKGTIKGHITTVASDDIFFQGDMNYANGTGYANASDSAAYLAYDDLFFYKQNLEVSGIFYSEQGNFTARYGESKNRLRIYGNRIMASQSSMSYYPDRQYISDPLLMDYPPPGLPVMPVVQSWTDLGK